jgi:hypothetical protein
MVLSGRLACMATASSSGQSIFGSLNSWRGEMSSDGEGGGALGLFARKKLSKPKHLQATPRRGRRVAKHQCIEVN